MAGETSLALVGNLAADPELRYTQSGEPVCNFRVASTPRKFDKDSREWVDGEAMFMTCTAWRQAAENVAVSLSKGDRVIVVGRLRAESYETRQGEKRTALRVDVDEVGPALRYATAEPERNPRQGQRVPEHAATAAPF